MIVVLEADRGEGWSWAGVFEGPGREAMAWVWKNLEDDLEARYRVVVDGQTFALFTMGEARALLRSRQKELN